jgi:hypothetical protein
MCPWKRGKSNFIEVHLDDIAQMALAHLVIEPLLGATVRELSPTLFGTPGPARRVCAGTR